MTDHSSLSEQASPPGDARANHQSGTPTGLTVARAPSEATREILSPAAVEFLAELHDRFGARREQLLDARRRRAAALRAGGTLDFLEETRDVRSAAWEVPPPRPDYADRRVEITGPTDAKLIINALGSGARGLHGRLRGCQLADLAQPDRRPGQPFGGGPWDADPRRLRRPPL